jgi:hypothetical protein
MPGTPFVSAVVMTMLQLPASKEALAYEAIPVGSARALAVDKSSQIHSVAVASAELAMATTPRAIANVFNFFIFLSFLLLLLRLFDY